MIIFRLCIKDALLNLERRQDIYNNPQHIYTKRLLSAIPNVNPVGREERKEERIEVEENYQGRTIKITMMKMEEYLI